MRLNWAAKAITGAVRTSAGPGTESQNRKAGFTDPEKKPNLDKWIKDNANQATVRPSSRSP